MRLLVPQYVQYKAYCNCDAAIDYLSLTKFTSWKLGNDEGICMLIKSSRRSHNQGSSMLTFTAAMLQ